MGEPTREEYERMAERCLRLALVTTDIDIAETLRLLANDYRDLARAAPARSDLAPPDAIPLDAVPPDAVPAGLGPVTDSEEPQAAC